MNCLLILEINPLLVASFANIFSHSEGYLFVLLAYGFFCCAKAFKFNQSPVVDFCSYFHYSTRWVKKDFAVIYVKKHSAHVFLQKFYSVCVTFRSLIHFVFIFVYGVWEYSNFILLYVAVQFSLHHLLRKLSFLYWLFLPPFLQIR